MTPRRPHAAVMAISVVLFCLLPGFGRGSEPIAVTGSVMRPDGSPRPGARVELYPFPTNFDLLTALLEHRPAAVVVASTASDATGRFSLAVPEAGIYRLEVHAEGAVPMRRFLLPLADPAALPPLVPPLVEPARFEVVDADGRPVSGAAVYARSAVPGLWLRWAKDGWEAGARFGWTDDRGLLTLPGLRGEALAVSVFPPGAAVPSSWPETSGGRLTLLEERRRPHPLVARTTGGAGVGGVLIAWGQPSWPLGRTDPDGYLTLDAGPEAGLVRWVTREGIRGAAKLGPIPAEGEAQVLQLTELVTFSGRVGRADTGEPLGGALVWPAYDPGGFVLADAEGRFRLTAPPDPAFRIEAMAAGYLPRSVTFEAGELDRGPLELRLETAAKAEGHVGGFPLSGRVLFEDRPLASAEVSLRGHDVTVLRQTRTDADGRFRLDGLDAGHYRLDVVHRGEEIVDERDLVLDGSREVRVEITAVDLSGRLVSAATGEGVADGLLFLRRLLSPDAPEQGALTTLASGPDGSFHQPRLAAGRYRLRVSAAGFQAVERRLDLGIGEDLEAFEIALEPTPGLELRVRRSTGAPPRLVHLRAISPRGELAVAETRVADTEGRVLFPTVPPGEWRLLVSAPGAGLTRSRAAVPGERIDVELPPAGRLEVRVPALYDSVRIAALTLHDPAGEPFQLLDTGGELRSSFRVEGGRASVPGVGAGTWVVTVTTPEGVRWQTTAVTTGGPPVAVRLE